MTEENHNGVCPKCKGSLRIQKADGTVQPCWDCLQNGKMDQHTKKLPEHGYRI